jgi:phage terminase large subunit GpA-like protein
MTIRYTRSAWAVLGAAIAAAIMPAEIIAPSAWAQKNMIVADGPFAGQPFDLALTPYLREPLDFWSDQCPDNAASFRKSKQIGASTLAIAALGYTAAVEPCDTMLVEPTDEALRDFASLKLEPTIEASPALKKKIRAQLSRSSKGSTGRIKRFAGGSLLMAIASSTATLRGKTRKKVIRDEASEYEADLAGQGSPHDMIAGAYTTFLASADWKNLAISTPVIKGACRIDAEFEAGDQRYWHVACPGCREKLFFKFDRKEFVFNEAYPFNAHYVAPCCGSVIESAQRTSLVRNAEADGGGWIATAPGPGKARSYHFDALSSPFVPWDEIAKGFVEAKDDPTKLKSFYNLVLGLPFEIKGDAPDHVRLLERREDYEPGKIPARGLLLVAGVDVQHSGLWYEVVAWASNAESWSIEHGFIEGETSDPNAGAFLDLDRKLYTRQFPDAFGATRPIDAIAIDAGDGGRANQIYAWSRLRPRAYAIKGMPGWTYPAIGTPTRVDIHLSGKKIKGGATLWPVGSWSLKATFYANLNKEGVKAGQLLDPPGYCHHSLACDERFFRQQTAEYLKTVTVRGRSSRVWQETGPNHLLDARVYAMAMAEYLGLARMTADQWAELARMRGVPIVLKEPDLLAPDSVKIAASAPARPALIGQPQRRVGRRIRGQALI